MTKLLSLLKSASILAAAAALASASALADVVYVTALPQGCTTTSACGSINTDGTYVEVGFAGGDIANTSIKGSAAGRPATPTSSRYYQRGAILTNLNAGVDIKPVLANTSVYQIDYNWNSSSGNSTTNCVMSVNCTAGGVLSTNRTIAFARSNGLTGNWLFIGYLTNSSTTPTVAFRYESGIVTANSVTNSRLLFDCWRFTQLTSCTFTPPVGVTGPLATNLASVVVTGVTNTATKITLYQNAGTGGFTNIGSLTVSSPGGTVSVPVTGSLVKGAQVAATQTEGGQEGCIPTAGTLVGGGANPRLRVALSVRQTSGLTGPIGTPASGASANIYWIHATGANVAGGLVLQPSTNWQTVIFYPTDSKFGWNGTPTLPDPNQYGVMEGLALAMDDTTDTGPFDIYVDNVRNGSTMIQNFESPAAPTQILFNQPSFSGTTSGNLLSAPNLSASATNQAMAGLQSERVNWQFPSLSTANWIRLNSGNTNGGNTANAEVDVTQPIAVDVLILPVNKTNAHALGLVQLLENRTNCPGDNVTFTMNVTPPTGTTPTYTYQWKFNGANIAGATASTFTTNGVLSGSAGTYSVAVSDGIATSTPACVLTVTPVATINAPLTDYGPVATGSQVDFFANASPTACSTEIGYRWQRNGTNLVDGGNISGAQTDHLTIMNAQIADAGPYRYVVTNTTSSDSLNSSVGYLYVFDPTVVQNYGNGTGVLGLYYSNHVAAAPFTNSPVWTNVAPGINFNWGTGAPDVGYNDPTIVGSNTFTVRWLGYIQPIWAQTYTIYTTNDDGIRVWIGNQLVVDSWANQSAAEHSGTYTFADTNVQPIVVEYYENSSAAVAQLMWQSASQVKDFVSSLQLYPLDPLVTYPTPPSVSITSPSNGSSAAAPGPVSFSATVTPNFSGVDKVQFMYNNTIIGTVTNPPYNFTWNTALIGSYNVYARALYDNSFDNVNSSTNGLTITGSAPTVLLSSPTNNASFSAPANLTLTATVSSNFNAISYVGFYNGANLIAYKTNTPYTVTTNSVAAGTYPLSVTAFYGGGSSVGSPTNTILVISSTPPVISGITYNGAGTVNIAGTGSAGQTFVLYTSTNVSLPIASWTPVQTNSAGSGSFNFPVTTSATPNAFFKVLSR